MSAAYGMHPARSNGFLYRGINRVELVIPGDDLAQPATIRVFLEYDEVLEQV